MQLNQTLGKLLFVDLTSGQIEKEEVAPELAQEYLGGFALGARLAYDLIPPGADPMAPENPVIFGAGVLGGTVAPASSKTMAFTKFPITGAVGAAVGGSGGDAIRYAGYSHIIVKGESETPVFLKVLDDEVGLENADWLWGKDVAETTDLLKERYGPDSTVICIGPAGENLAGVSFAYVNRLGHLGQGGLGAILGNKKLKALLIRGTGSIEVHDRKAFVKASDVVRERMMNLRYREEWLEIGPGIARWGYRANRPKQTPEEEAADVYGPAWYDKIFRGTLACPSCPVGCKALVEVREGEHAGELAAVTGAGSAWEKFNPGNMDKTMVLRDFCNRQGIDDTETAAVIDFAVKLFEAGVIDTEDTGGIELRRDFGTAEKLLHLISRREGFGDVLADGLGEAVKRIGKGSESYATLLKNRAALDPRLHFHAMTIVDVVNPRGYNAVPGNGPGFMPGHQPRTFRRYLERNIGLPQEEVDRICTDDDMVNMAQLTKHAEDYYGVSTSLGICVRQAVGQCYTINDYAELYRAATGTNLAPAELKEIGERAWNIIKAMNVREGFSREDDGFSEKWQEPLQMGERTFSFTDYFGNPIDVNAAEKILDDYYSERQWDVERGIPTPESLARLGLEFVVKDWEEAGILQR
jgi:aldehyde:ferredoxin oxidoreductase